MRFPLFRVLLVCSLLAGAAVASFQAAAVPPEKPRMGLMPRRLLKPVPVVTPCKLMAVPQLKTSLPYGPGEALSYSVAVNGAAAGSVDVTLGEKTTVNGRLAYPSTVVAQSSPVVSLWTRMRADATSVLDPEYGVPLQMKSLTRSDKHTYSEDVAFKQGQDVEVHTVLNEKPWDGKFKPTADALDAISLLYYARSRDFTVGQPFCMELYQSRVLWRIQGTVTGRETVDTDAGPFDTWAANGVAGIVGRSGAAAQEKRFSAWMTADEDRIPVLLKSPTPIGDVVVKLTRFEQGRRLARPKT